ncbi:hypothetical protein [Phenylobacterium sp.]|uniref:hypothetical protein n=1 Tax=Phenylobacterium sp. TaxID=1871053 RepID=UPI0025E6BEFA|nr:hypothetical protein [Phenylobacterium sp.]
MAFTYSDHAAVDEGVGLRIEHDYTWRDDGPWVKVVDLVGDMSFAFPLVTEARVISHPKWCREPWPAPVAHRLSRPTLWPYIQRMAEDRRAMGVDVDAEAMAEAVREGLFAYATGGGAALEWAPDFEVSWVETWGAVSGPLNRVVFTR